MIFVKIANFRDFRHRRLALHFWKIGKSTIFAIFPGFSWKCNASLLWNFGGTARRALREGLEGILMKGFQKPSKGQSLKVETLKRQDGPSSKVDPLMLQLLFLIV